MTGAVAPTLLTEPMPWFELKPFELARLAPMSDGRDSSADCQGSWVEASGPLKGLLIRWAYPNPLRRSG